MIDFAAAYSNLGAKLLENYAVLVMIVATFVVYVILAIWARYKDKKDIEQWSVYPLSDNLITEPYLYQVSQCKRRIYY